MSVGNRGQSIYLEPRFPFDSTEREGDVNIACVTYLKCQDSLRSFETRVLCDANEGQGVFGCAMCCCCFSVVKASVVGEEEGGRVGRKHLGESGERNRNQ